MYKAVEMPIQYSDVPAYINNIPIGKIESIVWVESVEVVGDYAMGSPSSEYVPKRVTVGSLILHTLDRHELLEQVFSVSTNLTSPVKGLTQDEFNKLVRDESKNTAEMVGSTVIGGYDDKIPPFDLTIVTEDGPITIKGLQFTRECSVGESSGVGLSFVASGIEN